MSDLIRDLKAIGRLPRLWEKQSKDEHIVWKAMKQPSWLVGINNRCKSMIETWYEDTDWARGEWGIDPNSKHIFDTDWSRWTEDDVLLIRAVQSLGIAKVLWC